MRGCSPRGSTEQFGYSIVIENRPGAASNIAAKAVAAAPPDGHTLLFTGNSYAINQTFYKNAGYANSDLRPVAFVAIDSQGLAVSAANPARTLTEFLDAGKAKPFTFGYGGSSAHIVAEYVFKVLTKGNATGVPFQSGAPALNALLGRHVDILAAPVAEVHPQVQQGAVRVLAVTGPRRASALPDAATLDELGLQGLGINGWVGILAPAKTPTGDLRQAQCRSEPGRRPPRGRQAPAPARLRALCRNPRRRPGLPDPPDRHLGQLDPSDRNYGGVGAVT